MRINKKILAGLTAVSMLTCGIWMESVFAADTFSAEESAEAVSDTVTDLSAESITGIETGEAPAMDAAEISEAEPENKSEISETPDMSEEPAVPDDTETADVSEAPDNPETQDTSEIPEEIELPENEEADIPQEMIRKISRKQHLRRAQHRKIWKQKSIRQEKRVVFAERRRIPYPGALMKTEFSRSQDREL